MSWLSYRKTEHRGREDRSCQATPSKDPFGPMKSRRVRIWLYDHQEVWRAVVAVTAGRQWSDLIVNAFICFILESHEIEGILPQLWERVGLMKTEHAADSSTHRRALFPHQHIHESLLYFTKLSAFLNFYDILKPFLVRMQHSLFLFFLFSISWVN